MTIFRTSRNAITIINNGTSVFVGSGCPFGTQSQTTQRKWKSYRNIYVATSLSLRLIRPIILSNLNQMPKIIRNERLEIIRVEIDFIQIANRL